MATVHTVFHRMRDVFRRTLQLNTDNRFALVIKREPVWCNLHENSIRWQHTVRKLWLHFNTRLTTMSISISRQCHAIAAQRVRRAVQITALYGNLGYDRRTLQTFVEKLGSAFIRRIPKYHVLLGLSMFTWQTDSITDDEMARVADEMLLISRDDKGTSTTSSSEGEKFNDWEQVINKSQIRAWRKPVPNSYLYEYKVYGSYKDVPARAFFKAELDLEFRKQWDKLIISLDVVDKDAESGTEVIHWVTHFPYPMYSRDYVFVRKSMVDNERQLMVIVNRSVDHPSVPVTDKYVRVNTYMSQTVIRPHSTFDENGFDYILTYFDDPKAAFPSFAYNWMATTGVPDYFNKVYVAAKMFHERKRGSSSSEEESSSGQRIPM